MRKRLLTLSVCLLTIRAAALRAQTVPPESVPPASRAIQQPLSVRTGQAGGVATVETALPGGGIQSVNTINSTVQVQGAYLGSVPSAETAGPPLTLSLDDAIKRALEYNLGPVALGNAVRQVRGQRLTALSTLLPNISGDLLVAEQQENLAALGFGGFPGIPTIVGPFHYVDLRAGVSQSVFDLTRIRNYRSSQAAVRATELSQQDARDLVVLAVTGGYLQVIASGARVDSARAQVATAQATYQQAVDRQAAGVAPRIDVTRSQVELQTEQQRLVSVQNDLAKQKINLGRVIGLPPGQEFALSDTLPYAPLTGITLEEALKRAYGNRSDLKAAAEQVRSAGLARDAAAAERYPTVEVSGDYGVLGPSPENSHGTFGVTGAVRFPIFQGGRIRGDIEQAEAALAQRRAEYQDLRASIDADVRKAFLDLTSAATQVGVAESNRGLAADTLQQSRDRFAAGVADTVEVVQAQEAVAGAEQDYIAALYAHNLAKASLARAVGQAGRDIRQFLGRP